MKKLLLLAGLTLSSLSAQAHTLIFPEKDVQSPTLGKVTVIHSKSGFSIIKNGITHPVQKHNVDKSLRHLDTEKLSKAIGSIYLRVTGDEENPTIQGAVRGPGGIMREGCMPTPPGLNHGGPLRILIQILLRLIFGEDPFK